MNTAQAMAQGTADAEEDMNGTLWFLAGCALGAIGILIAYVVEPTPPPTRLMGKSPDYAMAYAAAYKSAGKSAQGKQAIYGCLVGGAVSIAIYLIIVGSFVASAESSSGGSF